MSTSQNISRSYISSAQNRRIPADIWATVFEHCLPTSGNALFSETSAPLRLCQVCTFWRDVAFSTPRLWSSISVKYIGRAYRRRGEMVKAWLGRSGVRPLSISIICHQIPHNRIKRFLGVFTPYCSRWQHLQLSLPRHYIDLFLNNPDISMPVLESLEVGVTTEVRIFSGLVVHNSNHHGPPEGFSIPPTATRLHTIRFSPPLAATVYWPNLALPWSQLTHINGACTGNIYERLSMLRRCVNLQHCTIRSLQCRPWETLITAEISPVVFPHLLSLMLQVERGNLMQVLNNLVFCRLLSLEIDILYDYRNPFTSFQLLDRLMGSECTLERLIIPQLVVSGVELIDFIQRTPTLLEVVVDSSKAGDDFADRVMDLLTPRKLERLRRSHPQE